MTQNSLPDALPQLMLQGQALHQSGHFIPALKIFEQALQLDTANLDAANACATVLIELGRTKEAFHLLDFRRAAVLQDADSACNWAILAEQMRLPDLAQQGYEAALRVNPDHLRALNNSALMAASKQQWQVAIKRMTRCWKLAPDAINVALTLCDMLSAAHQHERALEVLDEASFSAPHAATSPELAMRRAVQLAYSAQWDAAQQAFERLDGHARELLIPYLESIGISASRFGWHAKRLPPVEALYQLQAFRALLDAHWAGRDALTERMQLWIDESYRLKQAHDWRDLQFFALMLPLKEERQGQSLQDARRYFVKRVGEQQLPPWREHADGRIHLAVAVQDLRDERQRSLTMGWLSRIDRARFAVHVFAQTPQPQSQIYAPIMKLADSFTETADLGSMELVAAIRARQTHIFIDTAYYTPSCRAELPFFGVAPIQLRHQSWQRLNPGTVQFVIGDHFTRPDDFQGSPNHDGASHGPAVRFAHSCWLHCDDTAASAQTPTRTQLGLPEDALVLCCRTGSPMIGPETFALWMTLLRQLPHAVLWLPSFEVAAQNNLRFEAERAKVAAHRLVFDQAAPRALYLAKLKQADLFVDTLLFNANHGLVEALRMGVPAISCSGNNMASRLGGSIIKAAGLADCVFDSREWGEAGARQKYLERVLQLGRDPAALLLLKVQLKQSHAHAPLFQADQQVAQWQSAFETMAMQARKGAEFTAFDVPAKA